MAPPPPGAPAAPIDLGVDRPADTKIALLCLAIGLATDLAVRSGFVGLAGALLPVAAAAVLWATRVAHRRSASVVLAGVPLFAFWLMARRSEWLLPLDVLAAATLLWMDASLARGGRVFDQTVPALLTRGAEAVVHGFAAPGFLAPVLRGRESNRSPIAPVLRGLLLMAPFLVLVTVLLRSADAVFAQLVELPAPVDLVGHVVLVVVGAWTMAGLLRLASARPLQIGGSSTRFLGPTEAVSALAALVLLYGVFALTQVVVLAGGEAHVLRTTGLTFAEYARSGFFQLLAVATLTLLLLSVLRAVVRNGSALQRRAFLVLAEVAIVLTLAIVAVAVRRLHLYEQSYGLTMLRLASTAFALWIGAVFLLLGARYAGAVRDRQWLVPAAAVAGGLVLLFLNVVNAEAVVVRRNVTNFEQTGRFDAYYAAKLSDDAVPALVAALPRLTPNDRAAVLTHVCGGATRAEGGLWAFNTGRAAAVEARTSVCPPSSLSGAAPR